MSFTCREPGSPVLVVEVVLDHLPEHVRSGRQSETVQQERNALDRDLRVFSLK